MIILHGVRQNHTIPACLLWFGKKAMKKVTMMGTLTLIRTETYHFLFGISALFSKINGNTNVPLPYETVFLAEKAKLSDTVVAIVANCFNSAFDSASNNSISSTGKSIIPQNWVKSKASIQAIQSAISNYISFLPTMNQQQNEILKSGLKMDMKHFEYRLTAGD